MALAFVQSERGHVNAGTTATTGAINTTSGNALFFGVANYQPSATISGVTDNDGGATPTQDVFQNSQFGTDAQVAIYSKTNIPAKSGYVATLTLSASGYGSITVEEVSGVATSSALDKIASNSGPTCTSSALSQNDEWAFGASANSQATPGTVTSSGWTQDRDTQAIGAAEVVTTGYHLVSDGAAQTFTVATLILQATALATYKAAGGAGGGAFVPIIGRGPGMALVGPGGLAGANA